MRRAFTLIELLVIIAIMGAMVAVCVVSMKGSEGAVRSRAATRDIFAAMRHARSVALVTQKPAIITYETVEEDGEVLARVEIASAKLLDDTVDRSKLQTLTGGPLPADEEAEAAAASANGKDSVAEGTMAGADKKDAPPTQGQGQTFDEVLFSPIDDSVVRGMRVKVLREDEELDTSAAPARRSRISVFSNVDYLLGKYKKAKTATAKAEVASTTAASVASTPAEELQEPVSIVWETNGRVEPHRVWVYADGERPENGLCIVVDRFGTARVISGDGREANL